MENNKLFFIATKKGFGKKIEVSSDEYYKDTLDTLEGEVEDYIKLEGGDSVISVFPIEENLYIFCVNDTGFGFKFKSSDLRVMGKETEGVRIMKLEKDEELVQAIEVDDDEKILVISYKDIPVKLDIEDVPTLERGSRGITVIKLDEKDHVDDVESIDD